MLYTLGAAVLTLIGLAAVRRSHHSLLIGSVAVMAAGYIIGAVGLLVRGVGAMGFLYLGAFVGLVGLVGVCVFGYAEWRWHTPDDSIRDLVPRPRRP